VTRVIAVANQKGGVGKTTTVSNLGAALAETGRIVLLVDMDPQAALTVGVGIDPYSIENSTPELLSKDQIRLPVYIRPLGKRLGIVPSSVDLTNAEYVLSQSADRTCRLKRALEAGKRHIDFILIDTPPNLGLLTVNALVAADELLIPVECKYLALRGVRSMMETMWQLRDQVNTELQLLGILATLFQPHSAHSREVLRELRGYFKEKVFQTVIEEDDAAAMAPAARKSVLEFRSESQAASAYRKLAQEVLKAESV
jgi:chromosome partitioning protein